MPTLKEIQLKSERVLVDPNAPPQAIHKLLWTRVGSHIQLDFAFIDQHNLKTALDGSRAGEQQEVVRLVVTSRFSVTPEVVAELHSEISKLLVDLQKRGLLPVEGVLPEEEQ